MKISKLCLRLLLLLLPLSYASLHTLTGVPPHQHHLYATDTLHCHTENIHIPIHLVNDDYCDCPISGLDEPGTSACENGRFYCRDRQRAQEALIPTAFVNDGVCDCCDGADEYLGIVNCDNTCKETQKKEYRKLLDDLEAMRNGVQARKGLAEGAVERSEARKQKLKDLVEEIDNTENEIDLIKQLEKESKKKKKKKNPKKTNDEEDDEEKVEGNNDNNQSPEEDHSESFPYPEEYRFDDHADVDLDDEELMSAIFDIEDDLADSVVPSEESMEDQEEILENVKSSEDPAEPLIEDNDEDFFDSHMTLEDIEYDEKNIDNDDDQGLISSLWTKISSFWSGPKDLVEKHGTKTGSDLARSRRDLENKVRELKKEKKALQSISDTDLGPNDQFESLFGECFKFTDRKYEYEVCPFDAVKQKEGHSKTRLGTFSGWADNYHTMKFENGQKCWNGPKRSTDIRMECGNENLVISASEPNMCEYLVVFRTPLVCDEVDLEVLQSKVQKLLSQLEV